MNLHEITNVLHNLLLNEEMNKFYYDVFNSDEHPYVAVKMALRNVATNLKEESPETAKAVVEIVDKVDMDIVITREEEDKMTLQNKIMDVMKETGCTYRAAHAAVLRSENPLKTVKEWE